jgi:sortase A
VKTSVLIIASFVVGALVVLTVLSRGSDGREAQSLDTPARGVEVAEALPPAPTAATVKKVDRITSPTHTYAPARINIPRIHLKAQVGTSLNEGPAWWPITGRPGGGDTVAIAGHRTTHTHPFLNLDRLEPGDPIYLRWQGVVRRYVMSGRRILSQKQRHIADARGHELLLLTACTPKGSARQRIVIYAWPA